jgi:hypothetical protein
VTRLIPRLLGDDDLPTAELRAARIDGEVYALDDWFAPVDVPDSAFMRAEALADLVPPRMIVERSSALWIHGAHARAPFRHQLCIEVASRTTRHLSPRFEVRELRLDPIDIVDVGPLRVTSHLRTVIDLLGTSDLFTEADILDVLAILGLGGLDVGACRERVRAQPRFPGARRALARLRLVESRARRVPGCRDSSGVWRALSRR